MKKLCILVAAIVTFAACKKNETDEVIDLKISFDQSEAFDVNFTVDDDANKIVAFNVVLDKAAPQNITATLSSNANSTAKEGSHFTLEPKELTFHEGESSTAIKLEILESGINFGDSLTIILDISSYYTNKGANKQLKINIYREVNTSLVTILDEGFEQGGLPTNWQAINVDGKEAHEGAWFFPANTWTIIDNADIVQSGAYAAGNNSWVADESGADDWLITSAIELGTNNVLKFFVKSFNDGYPNNCKVYISTSNDQASFSTVIYEGVAVSATDWTEGIVNIPASFENQTVYIAFRDDSNGDAIVLDDISLIGIK